MTSWFRDPCSWPGVARREAAG
ncbi:hypothetical protein AB4Z42_02880 [Mycobacterium sp. 2YAF39]